jgi:hypothetical protein
MGIIPIVCQRVRSHEPDGVVPLFGVADENVFQRQLRIAAQFGGPVNILLNDLDLSDVAYKVGTRFIDLS